MELLYNVVHVKSTIQLVYCDACNTKYNMITRILMAAHGMLA